jgi:UDP-glucuronate 4-epimerase
MTGAFGVAGLLQGTVECKPETAEAQPPISGRHTSTRDVSTPSGHTWTNLPLTCPDRPAANLPAVEALVTGCAGFIGSTLVDALLARGDDVVGVDCFTPYYDPATKRANLADAGAHRRFSLVEADLRTADLRPLLEGVDVVFHLAGQPGVRWSWAEGFAAYDGHNVLATQRLLEAARAAGTPRFVFASSSSVYGQAARHPTSELDLPAPHSPYGVTKLAAEHLCGLYAANRGLSTVCLRYFTVYGPRQRPDMAIHRLIGAGLAGTPFPLYGDGSAVRDFTFVDDVVAATQAAAEADTPPGSVMNVAGGDEVDMKSVVVLASDLLDASIVIDHRDPQPGDVERTGGAIDRAGELLGWSPQVPLAEGLARQAAWHRGRRAS